MNDRYLFRGKAGAKWVYGDLWHLNDGRVTVRKDGEIFPYEVIPETVGQYTGLNDKNGKRIFEGDVVEAYDETYDNGFAEVKGKVFFNCGSFDIDAEDIGYIPLYSYSKENIEVIGNVHDNGDLMKGE